MSYPSDCFDVFLFNIPAASIRAYSAQDAFKDVLHGRIDRYIRASRSFYNVNRYMLMVILQLLLLIF